MQTVESPTRQEGGPATTMEGFEKHPQDDLQIVERIDYRGSEPPAFIRYGAGTENGLPVAYYSERPLHTTTQDSSDHPQPLRAYTGHADEFKYFAQLLAIEEESDGGPLHSLGYSYSRHDGTNGDFELRFSLPDPSSLKVSTHNAFHIDTTSYQGRLEGGDFTLGLIGRGFALGPGTNIMSVHEHFVHFPFLLTAEPHIAERAINRARSSSVNGGREPYGNFERDFEFSARAETILAGLTAGDFSDAEISRQLTSFEGCDPAIFKVHDSISHLLYGENLENPEAIQDTINYIRHLQTIFRPLSPHSNRRSNIASAIIAA